MSCRGNDTRTWFNLLEKYLVQEGGGSTDRGSLPPTVKLVLCMKVMANFNIQMELDIANGARVKSPISCLMAGSLQFPMAKQKINLKYPAAYVLIKITGQNKTSQSSGLGRMGSSYQASSENNHGFNRQE